MVKHFIHEASLYQLLVTKSSQNSSLVKSENVKNLTVGECDLSQALTSEVLGLISSAAEFAL